MEHLQDDLCKFTLLYIENDSDPLELVGRMLYMKYPNIKVLFAENQADALAKAKKHQPDIYLIDIDVAGDELIQYLRKDEETRVIVICSDDCEITERCLSIGVADYIIKPVNMDLLLPKLDAIAEALFWKRLSAARGLLK